MPAASAQTHTPSSHRLAGRGSIAVALLGLLLIMALMVASEPYRTLELGFRVDSEHRAGTLVLPPADIPTRAVVIFVHGDGAMGRSAFGYYYPLWRRLAQLGVAAYSWDKAGVGASTGAWLEQTMAQRSEEVLHAISAVKKQPELAAVPLGLLGFSQAAWVMPKVLNHSAEVDFAVFVSTPINWLQQSHFLTQSRVATMKGAVKQQQIDSAQIVTTLLQSGASYQQYRRRLETLAASESQKMSAARYQFVQQNINADASAELRQIKQPVFVAFGRDDSQLDAERNAQMWRQLLASKAQLLSLKVYPNAGHTLLKNAEFGHLEPSLWWLLKVALWQQDGFSPAFLSDLSDWLEHQLDPVHQSSNQRGKRDATR